MTDEERAERRRRAEALGRAAERFGQEVARDARRFVERMSRHAERFAAELARPAAEGDAAGGGLGRVLGDVLENVDQLVGRLWQPPAATPAGGWHRVTAERDVTCVACRKRVRKGSDCWRSPGSGTRTRCLACGVPQRARTE